MLLAQKFERMGSEINHQQPSGGPQNARGLQNRAGPVIEKMQNLVDEDDVKRIVRQREVVDVALSHAAVAQPGAIETRARECQHIERQIKPKAAFDLRPE